MKSISLCVQCPGHFILKSKVHSGDVLKRKVHSDIKCENVYVCVCVCVCVCVFIVYSETKKREPK